MNHHLRRRARRVLLLLVLAAGPAFAQPAPVPAPVPVPVPVPMPGPGPGPAPSAPIPAPPAPTLPAVPAASAPQPGARLPVALPEPGEPRPYERVITADARTQRGLVVAHTVKTRLYFEIPTAVLGQPLLMVANATAVPAGFEHVGRTLNQDVLRFVLQQNRVLLQLVSHSAVTAPGNVLADAVQLSQREPILAAFPVEAFAKGGAPVIEVTRLFNSELGDFSARAMLRGGMDASRSYVEKTRVFPGSIRVDAVHTYTVGVTPTPVIPGMPVVPQVQPARSASLNVAYNIVQLPQQPMRPRLYDDRVGFFSVSRMDFGDGLQAARREQLITRWRLEKKEPEAALSEPVKPIVWYIDKATPKALVPFVKRGVEAWNTAFEAAGFRNAVQARPYPTAEEDPEFDPEDVRYSVIRWVPSPIANAYGPHLADPRSGEILNANIVLFHNILQLQQDWYITQVGPLDPRARKLPLPDDLMGDLIAYVVTHEVGHSLGFPHNMKASSLYPLERLRDPQWLKTMGFTPSLMDYARFHYVAQPQDGIAPDLLIPKIGPYDVFATRWGYAPIPEAQTPEQERPQLNRWAREQERNAWLRFAAPRAEGGDFGENAEAVGDADAVAATTLGLRNLKRVVTMLPAVVPVDGKDDQPLERLYIGSWQQWANELVPVVNIVGGYEVQNRHNDQPGALAVPLPRERQAAAVKFVAAQGLTPPPWLLDAAIVQRLGASQPMRLVALGQRLLLRQLLAPQRTRRMMQQEEQLGARAYRVEQLLAELRRNAFGAPPAAAMPAAVQRSLQRQYVDTLIARVRFPASVSGDDGAPHMRQELRELRGTLVAAASRGDLTRRAHLRALADDIERALDPGQAAASGVVQTVVRVGFHDHAATGGPDCWAAHAQGQLLVDPAAAHADGW